MRGEWRVFPREAGKPANKVAELAARQRGIVTNEELRGCGLTRHEIETWLRTGRLHEKHRGVYAVGHRTLTVEARWLAATKACGPDAALSHYSAAAAWDLVPWDGRRIEVTTTTRREHPGIRIHRTTNLERVLHKGIPVTPPARVLIDLSPLLPFIPYRQAVRQAYNRHLVTTAELARAKPLQLRRIIADIQPTRSVLEDLALDLLREAGFEDPLVNQPLGGYVPDFRWPHRNLIVEADGGTHDNDLARSDDARRTAALHHRVVRISWAQCVLQPARTVARLRAEETRSRAGAAPGPPCARPSAV